MIGEISLEGMEFFAYHGFYSEERKIGNKYGIDITITADVGDSPQKDDLTKTVDYEKVYQTIKKEVEIPTKLLETIAHRISNVILKDFEQAISVKVCVSKFNPPVGGICQSAKVSILQTRD
jgi:7,8-dihydroneopterin aldolase/epimerase/oxygenase